jgi:AcrR family transcriptional regulator
MEHPSDCSWPSSLPRPFQPLERAERRDAREHRQHILAVARQLFAERGVEAVSMQQIAAGAGVGKGTLYRCYAHKGDLCMDILQERHEQFVRDVGELLVEAQDRPALERLDGLLRRIVTFLEEQGALLNPIVQIALRKRFCAEGPISRIQQPVSSPFLWLRELITSLLIEAVQRREITPLDAPYTADAILAALQPTLYHFQRQERDFSSERILQGLRHIYIDGVKPPGGSEISG